MKKIIRSGLVFITLIAGLGGCSSTGPIGLMASSPPAPIASPITHAAPPAQPASPSIPPPAGLDDYKTLVARHVLQHNADLAFAGTLPPLMPAVVVLRITVDQAGALAGVEVQRARDTNAAQVALDSMRRSAPLPPPQRLAQADGRLTFSETFLFGERYRYQLRSLAPVQASE
ncbi:lipoprotein [uncultured Massilia sp.]|uniref:LptM family lipoprotein n=1 Tax=uncultured Massilia sp. TaxID=169973 RepID=UPI0025F51D15|nr:energy transducer TonB [uncultured Massilia sp.]